MDQETLIWYMKIFHPGEAKPAASKELEAIFGIRGAALRRSINAMRRQGVPIASGENGYYYAETELEVRRTIAHLKHRISGISAAIRGLEKCLPEFDAAQTRLPLEGGEAL